MGADCVGAASFSDRPGGAVDIVYAKLKFERESTMAYLRNFAICVSDLDKSAKFYGDVFGMERHGREDISIGSAIYMGDGTINLALLNFVGTQGHDFGDNATDTPRGQDRICQHLLRAL